MSNSTINELLNRNPMDLSEKDLDQLVAHFRTEREKWQAKPSKKKAPQSIDLDFDFSKLRKK